MAAPSASEIGNREVSESDFRFPIVDLQRGCGVVAQAPERPLPRPSDLSRPFWEGLKSRDLRLQRCADCGEYIFYPRPACTKCMSENLTWTPVSGQGKVYTYTIVRRAMIPAFQAETPYVFAIVELEEGPRLPTNVIGCDPESVWVDMPVKAAYDDVTEEITLLKFEPA